VSLQKELGDPNTVVAFQNTPGSEFYPTKSETLFASIDDKSAATQAREEKVAETIGKSSAMIVGGGIILGVGYMALSSAATAGAGGSLLGALFTAGIAVGVGGALIVTGGAFVLVGAGMVAGLALGII
jgi:hypothetical protein